MAAKLSSLFITFILCIAIGIVVLATMLIAMNGYNGNDASWGLGLFVVLAIVISILMALASYFLTGFLSKKQYKTVAAIILPTLAFSIIGAVLQIIASLVGVAVAEFVRVNY